MTTAPARCCRRRPGSSAAHRGGNTEWGGGTLRVNPRVPGAQPGGRGMSREPLGLSRSAGPRVVLAAAASGSWPGPAHTKPRTGLWRDRGRTYSRRWEPGVLGCPCHSARHSRSRRPARLPGFRCPTAARGSSLAERATKIKRRVLRGTGPASSGPAGSGGPRKYRGVGAPPRPELHQPEGVMVCPQLGQPRACQPRPHKAAGSSKVEAGHQNRETKKGIAARGCESQGLRW